MTGVWGRPPHEEPRHDSGGSHNGGYDSDQGNSTWAPPTTEDEVVPEAPRRKPRAVVIGAAAVILAAAVVSEVYVTRSGGDNSSAYPAFTSAPGETSTETSDQQVDEHEDAEVIVTSTVTVHPEPTAVPAPRPEGAEVAPSQSARSFSGGGLSCDGRGVLVVNSVMGDSPDVDGEISTALAEHPGAVVVAPGTCASLRSMVDGVPVYAVLIDYGDDVSSLCAAEASGEGYSRILDNQASYRSPC